jgi:hypothetical protein
MPDPVVEEHDGVRIVRDDLIEGGSKVPALGPLLERCPMGAVYASPAQGYAQLALAVVGREQGCPVTIFVPARRQPSTVTKAAARLGAQVIQVPAGRLNVLQHRARCFAEQSGAELLPFGLAAPEMSEGLKERARAIPAPSEVWVAAGSGTLARAVANAWPDTEVHAVQVGRRPELSTGIRLWEAPEKFEDKAKGPQPPVPSAVHYDAKVWRFVVEHSGPGALWWNVAGEPRI